MKDYIIHIVALNFVCAFLGWWLTNGLPERVYVTADTDPGLVVQTDCGRGCRFDGHGLQTQHFWLPVGYFTGSLDLTLHIPPAVQSTNAVARTSSAIIQSSNSLHNLISSVRVWSRIVFERQWSQLPPLPNSNLQTASSSQLTLQESASSFSLSRAGVIILVFGELAIALCSLLFLFLTRFLRPSISSFQASITKLSPPKSWTSQFLKLLPSLLVAFCFSLFLVFIVPAQTLLANKADLDIPIGPVILSLSGCVVLLTIFLSVFLHVTTRFAGYLYLILVTAFLLYEYLETGVLSIGFPELTGDVTFYKDLTRMTWDALVIPLCFLFSILLIRLFPKAIVFLPCAVCLLGISSLFDVRSIKPEIRSDLGVDFKPKNQVAEECAYSTNRNILVYVLDSAATTYLQEIFEENPRFAEPLTGFTFYTNNLAMWEFTAPSVAGMTTGKYFDNPNCLMEYYYSVFSRDSLLSTFLDGKTAVSFNPGSFDVGVSIGGMEDSLVKCAMGVSPLSKRMAGQQPWSLFEIVRFRELPFFVKYLDYVFTVGGWDIGSGSENESWLYPRLKNAPLCNRPLAFHWFHTYGMHAPFGISRNGVDDGIVAEGDAAKVNKLWYVWSQLIDLFEELKNRGLYDSSTIVVTADHGIARDSEVGCLEKSGFLSARAFPILLVKPSFATNSLRRVGLPTSLSRIHDLLVKAHDQMMDVATVDATLESNSRFFCVEKSDGFERVSVDSTGLTAVLFVKKAISPIEVGRYYSLCGDNSEDRAPLQLERAEYWTTGPLFVWCGEYDSAIKFLANDIHREYLVSLEVSADAGSKINAHVVTKNRIRHTCKIRVKADEHGLATVKFSAKGYVSVFSIKVEK